MITIVWTTTQDRLDEANKLLSNTLSKANLPKSIDFLVVPTTKIDFIDVKDVMLPRVGASLGTDLVVITSKNTIRAIEYISELHYLKNVPTITVGSKTKEYCLKHGYTLYKSDDDSSPNFKDSSEAFSFIAGLEGKFNIIYPGAVTRATDHHLKDSVTSIDLYKSNPLKISDISPEMVTKLKNISNFVTCFSSPSSFDSYIEMGLAVGQHQFALGQTTGEKLRSHGLSPVCASEPTTEILLATTLANL
jgi:uroporphyrinogen-III synthase